ncbi:hypothetical protein SDC9_118008 [bioreactor metagenome]|uniref:Uncharacterized protein n=1 Tax=bioreactor metagenome TaxID=1076179 RepID=A0A645C0I5_9ZZZZ
MPRQDVARGALEQREPLVQPVQQVTDAEGAQPDGGQLDRQRHPVQMGAQLDHLGAVVGADDQVGAGPVGPVDEQPDRLGLPDRVQVGAGVGHLQRRDDQHLLPGDPQRFPGGRDDPHLVALAQDRPGQAG